MATADLAVDLYVQRHEHSLGHAVSKGFYPNWIIFMEQQSHHAAYQMDGRFIEPSIERNRSVPVHLAVNALPEVIIQILWRLPEQVFPRLQSGLSTLMELTKLGIRREQLWRNTQGLIYFICLKRIILYDEKTCYTSPTTGMFIVNVVPFPTLLSTFISPLCFFTIS